MQMNLPNKLTISRVIMIPIFVVVLLSGLVPEPLNRYIATLIFMVASFTDYLDGHLARKYNLCLLYTSFAINVQCNARYCKALISTVYNRIAF